MAPYTIRFRRDTEARWDSENPILHEGELGYVTDLNNYKIGDGTTRWADLPFVATGGGGVSDHGQLTGRTDDDHAQYALADGTRGDFATLAQGLLADSSVQQDSTYAPAIDKIVPLTQAQYDALGTPDNTTLYLILDA